MRNELSLEQIREILSPESLRLSPGVAVVRIEVNPYVDWHGEDSLDVLIVLKDGTEIPLPKGWSLETRGRIHNAIQESGCELWPYTHYALESELLEAVEE